MNFKQFSIFSRLIEKAILLTSWIYITNCTKFFILNTTANSKS